MLEKVMERKIKATESEVTDAVKECLFKIFKTEELTTIIGTHKSVERDFIGDSPQHFLQFLRENPSYKITSFSGSVHVGNEGERRCKYRYLKDVDYTLQELFDSITGEILTKVDWINK
jgi:hypothetical protein